MAKSILTAESIIEGAAKINVFLRKEQGQKLALFSHLLWKENKIINLVHVESERELLWKHFLDSLAPLARKNLLQTTKTLDLGSGGGFPGIPLKIAEEQVTVYLLEANQKKADFLGRAIKALSLNNAFVLPMRAENAARESYRGEFDLVVSRAVASLPTLVELALPLVKKGGFFWAYKGPEANNELEQGTKSLQLCGGKVSSFTRLFFPEESGINTRFLIEIYKEQDTPVKYPRKPGIPRKRPLL